MSLINEISEAVQNGSTKAVRQLVQQSVDEGISPQKVLNEGLMAGMKIVGEGFKNEILFVPEVLVAARAMNAGIAILEPLLADSGAEPFGRAVIGTVKGDLHDIGKNLVAMMLRGAGFEVIDLGVDVEPEAFVEKAEKINADVICLSALLTTTMGRMKTVIDSLIQKGIRSKYIIMIGGAPVNEVFAENIGADYFTPDAASCAEVARAALLEKRK